jgi:hypothetical protein
MNRSDLRRRAASSNSNVALDAMWRLGLLQKVSPTTDTGFREYGSAGRLPLPAATNYVTNPTSAVNVTDFWNTMTDVTLTRDTNPGVPFPAGISSCMKVVFADTGATRSLYTDTAIAVSANEVYTISVYCYVPSMAVAGSLLLRINTLLTGTLVRSTLTMMTPTVGTGFVRYSGTVTIAASGENQIQPRIVFTTGSSSTSYWTGFQLEKAAAASPYFDGGTHDCAWTGAANASTSTRTATGLIYPTGAWVGANGTTSLRAAPLWAGNDSGNHWFVAAIDGGNQIRFDVGKNSTNAWFSRMSNGGKASTLDASAVAAGSLNSLVGRYAGIASCDVRANGTNGAQDTIGATTVTVTAIVIGDRGQADRPALAYLSNVSICPSRLTDAESVTLDAMQTAGASAADIVRWFRTGGYVNTLVIPLAGDSNAYQIVA